jgi:hypothetical protein
MENELTNLASKICRHNLAKQNLHYNIICSTNDNFDDDLHGRKKE